MTIDEAIKLCKEGSKSTWNGRQTTSGKSWQQMAEWLEELKQLREQKPCDDAISREDALQALCKAVHKNDDTIPCSNQRVSCLWDKTKVQDYAKEILRLSPVTPQSKMGRWVKTIGENGVTSAVRCSECGFEDNRYELFNYCPNCGRKMQEVEE